MKSACIASAETGEVLYKFAESEVLLGKQYLTATCRASYFIIEDIRETDNHITFYVR